MTTSDAAPAPRPSRGVIVDYVDPHGDFYPAIVRKTYDEDPNIVDLTAFTHAGTREVVLVFLCGEGRCDTWHWPEAGVGAGLQTAPAPAARRYPEWERPTPKLPGW